MPRHSRSVTAVCVMAVIAALLLQPLFLAHRLESQSSPSPLLMSDVHQYFRPSGDQVSGLSTNNTAPFHRSPCPALNALANHGLLPRDGKALTPLILHRAIQHAFNFDQALVGAITQDLPAHFTLADLGDADFIEHDGSLVHDDAFFGQDPAQVNVSLVEELLSGGPDLYGGNGILTTRVFADFRRHRESQCASTNPHFHMTVLASFVAYGESAIFLLGAGDYATMSISTTHARAFLMDERIPPDFSRSETPVSVWACLYGILKLRLLAWLHWDVPALATEAVAIIASYVE